MYVASTTSKKEAIKQLGKEDDYINLAGFNTERTNAQNTYDTNYNALQNEYNRLLETAEQNKLSARKSFNDNRYSVAVNDYMNNRGKTGADLSDRGLSSGFADLGKLGNVLKRDQATSNLANTYYNTMADIKSNLDYGTQTHNYNVESLKNQLAEQLANINAREAAQRNAYRAQVAQLAEQIQSRWDNERLINKQIEQINDDINWKIAEQYKAQLKGVKDADLGTKVLELANKYKTQQNVDLTTALNWLKKYGVYSDADLMRANEAISKSMKSSSLSPWVNYQFNKRQEEYDF